MSEIYVPKIGIIQGRLSPPQDSRLQFFPQDWQAEFQLAKTIGFDCIEWYNDHRGINQLREIWRNFSMIPKLKDVFAILSVTSMDTGKFRLHSTDNHNDSDALISLILSASVWGIKKFNLPIMEQTTMKTDAEIEEVFLNLRSILDFTSKISQPLPVIAIETDLPGAQLRDLLDRFQSPRLGVCYDIGNCTSYGFDCPSEIRLLKEYIFSVHIKDRKINSDQSVSLGTGDADFKGCFRALLDIDYQDNYILQAWRGINYLDDARTQLAYIKNIIHKL